MNDGLRIAVRLISRLVGIAVGFFVYQDYGLWPAIAAGVAAWLIVVLLFGVFFARKKAREYVITPGDVD